MMAMVAAFRGAIHPSHWPTPTRCNRALSWSVCPRRSTSNASLYLQDVARVSCRAAEAGTASQEDDEGTQIADGVGDGGGRAALQQQHQKAEVHQKIWMRKQAKIRALDLVTVTQSAADGRAITRNEIEHRRTGEVAAAATAKQIWFPYVDEFQETNGGDSVSSEAVLELLGPFISDERKQRIENVIQNRTFSVPVVVEGLSDVGNISAICRTADALGFQSMHIISNDSSLRYKENHRTSAGAEKWLDMERWDDTESCIKSLKARGYRIAVTHISEDTVSIHDMDWTVPTAIVLGNEHRGISEESIALSDVRCSIPMAGMVESFNVSVAAAIIMHHAVTDRISRMGMHGDLSKEERNILLADFYMRHRDDTKKILKELVDRRNVTKPRLVATRLPPLESRA